MWNTIPRRRNPVGMLVLFFNIKCIINFFGSNAAFNLPADMLRLNLSHVGVTTLPAESFVRVAGFSPTYTLCGGRSAPKIVECIGDDGCKYKQLVKVKN
jgi:hypothetical protein